MKKTKISYFSKASDTNPSSIYLEDWLKDTLDPPIELKAQVEKYRNYITKDEKIAKRLKTNIPCVTISATFKKNRDLDNIKKKNDFIVLDIDRFAKSKIAKCNLCLDFERAKVVMSSFKSCLYVGYSVSSDGHHFKDGLYAVIKLKKGTSLKKAFKYFKEKLNRIGINIDESCKDYTRLRFFSYDSEAYYNKKAKPFSIPKKRKLSKSTGINVSKSDEDKVNSIVNTIEANSIDITSNYEDWYKIAGSLYNSFGETGRSYFQRISKFHPDYKEKTTDRKFSNCTNMKKLTLSTLFHIATREGIRY